MEQPTSMVQIKGYVQNPVWTPEFDMKYLKKAEEHVGQKIVIIRITS